MNIFLLKETLEECALEDLKHLPKDIQYSAVLTSDEWAKNREFFDMGIDIEPDLDIHSTKAEVNYDSLTGAFLIPDRSCPTDRTSEFAYALDEKGIVFIDNDGNSLKMLRQISRSKKWRAPSLERFLYDFLELIIDHDQELMESYDDRLYEIEDRILTGVADMNLSEVNDIRGDIRALRVHYEQLVDMAQELDENENGFFREENLRYFHLFMNRMARLMDQSTSLRDHTTQVRDLYHTQLDVRQNHIMAVLTVVTSIFMPLTLIAGWYGMNFQYMPELYWKISYPVVIIICILIVIISLIVFRKKKWI